MPPYNANPESMRAGLRAVKALAGTRRTVAVLGAMGQQADASHARHAEIGRLVADLRFNVLTAVGAGDPLAMAEAAESLVVAAAGHALWLTERGSRFRFAVMASRGTYATTDLRPLLTERGFQLSQSQVYRLVVERPERLNLRIQLALLDILDCTIGDLIEPIQSTDGPDG
ncbi:glutamate ligase domain-containing protein [Nonomuraea sp. H19]|uniref:helix-turn-helix domain-containing protein n=1 Tax=Nonomuraea sp. H19 TaxID=3452206 RepID=UPI003F8C49F2